MSLAGKIDDYFSENYKDFGKYEKVGSVIDEEADKAGLDLADACALVEQESGGRNIFGCDNGDSGDTPPYCQHKVTKARVQNLIDSPYMNGVGLTQLTWWAFVEEAHEMGGAHLPRYQCRVGFRILADYLKKYDRLEAFGAYNAGETNRWLGVNNGYAAAVEAKSIAWKNRLLEAPPEPPVSPSEPREWPTTLTRLDSKGWLRDNETGAYVRSLDLLSVEGATDSEGWWYAKVKAPPTPPTPEPDDKAWEWPKANDAPIPGGYYWEAYPTRYTFRPDVEKIARRIVDKYPGEVWANTYYIHPPDVYPPSREVDSVDFWDYAGRGYAIDYSIGQAIFDELFDDPAKPDIEWTIWQGWLYSAANSWQGIWWGDHFDHVHITYRS